MSDEADSRHADEAKFGEAIKKLASVINSPEVGKAMTDAVGKHCAEMSGAGEHGRRHWIALSGADAEKSLGPALLDRIDRVMSDLPRPLTPIQMEKFVEVVEAANTPMVKAIDDCIER